MPLQCRACGRENPDAMSFCVGCATPLTQRCPSCGFESPHDAAFCGKCAAALAPRPKPTVERVPREAERRQLTVMFCDLVGSTALSERIDSEELREVLRAYQDTCGGIVRRFGGTVALYPGDGLVVYFGYPQAHEDDPARGVRAALAILDELPPLNARLGEELEAMRDRPLALRIGIHTGAVIVGAMGDDPRRDEFALGDTMNIAARLEAAAEPGWVVVSAATRRRLGNAFAVEDLGTWRLKGIADRFPVFRVLRASTERRRSGHAAASTPLVGREQEISLMLDRWEQVTDGHGQVAIVSGEAGMGKSRLVQALRERLAAMAHRWLECGCSAYHENSAFHPVIECLEEILFGDEDSAEVKIAKLEAALRPTVIALDEAVPLLAMLLSVPLPDRYAAPDHLSTEAQRRKTMEAVTAWLFAVSEQRPVVLVVEDLHWIDPSSLQLLQMLVGQLPTTKVFLVLTFRPGVDVSWASRSHVVHLNLHPLTRKQVTTIVDRVAGGKALPMVVVEQVVAKTDGVPLFVEELTKAILESDLLVERDRWFDRTDLLPALAIPTTLQDSLTARLDRLGAAKEVAQVAAVLGREFPHDILEAVSSRDAASLGEALDELAAAELLYRRGTPPRAVYTFKHALVQEAAYRSLLKKTRQEHHARIARVLEERFPERVAVAPEVVARHYEEAGIPVKAIVYYEQAGERAAQRSAHAEAIAHLRRGIELLGGLPPSPERDHQEIRLQVKLGAPLLESRGYGGGEVERAYARARELCQGAVETPETFRALWGLAVFYHARNELGTALEMGNQLLDVAERSGDVSLLISAYISVGCPMLWQGKFAKCLSWVERTIALYDPEKHRSLAYVYGENPGVSSRTYAAMALWFLGFPDRALRMMEEAVSVAEDAKHPFSLGYALSFTADIHVLRRERDAARRRAEETIALAEEQHLSLWLGTGSFYRGWTIAEPQGGRDALGPIGAAVAQLAASGTKVGAPSVLGMFAEAQGACGKIDDALQTLEGALVLAEARQSMYWNAELHRLKGELLLRRDGNDAAPEAERLFRLGLAAARDEEARSLELRSAVSLARLLRRQDRVADARALLAPIYAWFTEGLNTGDLVEARALLDELS